MAVFVRFVRFVRARARGRAARVVTIGCVLGLLGLLAGIGGWWPAGHDDRTITGYFTSAVAVFPDNDVRILGVPVGTIISVQPQGRVVEVVMEIDDSVDVPADAAAVVVAPSLVTGRHIQLTPAYTGGPTMADGAVIPLERTAVPLGVDDLIRTADELATMLGPRGINRPDGQGEGAQGEGLQGKGVLADLLDVAASNLAGNGPALNETVGNLAELSETLSGSREELFGTVAELQSFTSTLAANDPQVRQFTTQLADVSNLLAGERADLAAALNQLSVTLGEVAAFVQDNRAVLKSNVDRLTEVTAVLVAQRDALAEILDVAPTGLSNVYHTYNASSGTLDTRLNVEELREVISAVRAGQPPPLPLLVVPTVPVPR